MLRWRAPTPMAERITSIGRSLTGEFKTKHLKEYPSAFAAGLAQCVADTLQRRYRQNEVQHRDPGQADVQWIDSVMPVVTQIHPAGQMMPDYQPGLA